MQCEGCKTEIEQDEYWAVVDGNSYHWSCRPREGDE